MRKNTLIRLLSTVLITAVGFFESNVQAQDVYKAAPDKYKLLGDTLGIRLLEAVYKPGASSPVHSHPDFVLYVMEGGNVEFTGANGAKQVVEFKTGSALIIPANVHSAKNIGNTTLRVLVVEINRPMK